MAKVVFKNVNKVFEGGVQAVRDFNLEIADREFLVLVGPSGCGKSTTMRMVAGLEEVTSGDISIDDRRVNDVQPKDRDIAMVFQNYALYPHMTVFDNMAFGLKMRKHPRVEIAERVHEAAEILGITDLLQRKPKQLSGGQRQRVAVGRAIVRKPKVFLFDEPLSNLDAKLRVQMRAELIKLHNRLQATMIYVTHDQLEAMTMGDRIVVMKDGLIQQVDAPLDLYEQPKNQFVAGFIGTPPMNFMQGTLESSNGLLFFNEGTFRLALPEPMAAAVSERSGQGMILGVRPEDILEAEGSDGIRKQAFNARVEVVEPVGSESYWYLSTGKSTFVARVHAHAQARVDEEKRLVFRLEKAHLFDSQTEETLV